MAIYLPSYGKLSKLYKLPLILCCFFLSVHTAHAQWDGNAPKTYILGTTPHEKEALQVKRNGEDIPLPQHKPETQVVNTDNDPLFEASDQNQPALEHRLVNPSAADILNQIEK